MVSAIQLAYNGLAFGSVIVLAAMGLSLLYGIGNFANFAHGELLTVGAYLTLLLYEALGLPFLLAAALSVALTAGLGVLVDRGLMVHHRTSSSLTLLLITVGVAFILRSFVRIVWSSSPRSYGLPLVVDQQVLDSTFTVAGYDVVLSLSVSGKSLLIIAVGVLAATTVHLFLTRTKTGVAMRATSANRSLAKVTGIDTEYVATTTWVVAASLAAVSGVVLAYSSGVIYPRMGFDVLLVVFAAVILGGIGSPYGAMVGAYVISVAREFSVLIPGVGSRYKLAVAFLVMIVVLLVKPTGIFGGNWS